MSIRTKLILVFSILFTLLLVAFAISTSIDTVNTRKEDAKHRIITIIGIIHNAKKNMEEANFKKFIRKILHTRLSTPGYDMDIASIKIKEKDKVIEFKKEVKGEETIKFRTFVKNPLTGKTGYEIELNYMLGNLYRGILKTLLKIFITETIILLTGIAGIMFFTTRITSPIKQLIRGMQKISEGEFKTRVNVNTQDEIGKLANTFNWMAKKLEEGEFVKSIFKRYVTHQLAEQLIKNQDALKLKGDKKRIAVLFGDIRNFTKISQNMTPEEVFEFLNFYFEPIIDIVFEQEGILDKFIGDGFLAFWNAPLPQKDYIKKAAVTALKIQKKLKELNKINKKDVKIGIGVNVGYAIAGNVGSTKRMEYTVIGDTVNFAERLQEAARDGEILVSEEIYKVLQNEFVFKKRTVKMEGYGDSIVVYELIVSKEDI